MSNVYSVGQVNRYVKNMFVQDYFLKNLQVGGEVSNCKYHTSGHIYFSLKDATGALSCVMFAGQRGGLGFRMKDGDRVIVTGSISVYERDGRYQLYARAIQQDGMGALYEKFLRLKQELEEMGMFDAVYKKPIPRFVRCLGVVTAPTGAAIQDIRNVSLRRNPGLQLILSPALVQGEGAAESIVQALQLLDRAGVDVIILGRGGGSLEDLWAFNREEVARAVFECSTPVISAVGHETDFTITDFVADLRAPTPSAAAELAVEDISAVTASMKGFFDRLSRSTLSRLEMARSRLEKDALRLKYVSPEARLLQERQYTADLQDTLERRMRQKLQEARTRLAVSIERLEGLSPVRKLNQGYSYVSDQNGRAVYRTDQVKTGDRMSVYVTDGVIDARVEGVYVSWGNGQGDSVRNHD